jgi:type IV secretion system protein VirB4
MHPARVRRELDAASNIPYTGHVSEHVLKTRHGDYVLACRLDGASFESADDEQLNNWHERLNALWRNLASPNLALWAHIIRRRERVYPSGEFRPGFARDLNEKYRAHLADETLMVNELYVSLVFRPQASATGAATLRMLERAGRSNGRAERSDSLDACAKLEQQLLTSLDRYDPEPLGVYRSGAGYYSSLLEFLGVLVNAEWQRVPLPRAPINEILATTRPFFGVEAIEYRTATHTRFGALLGIKEYPTPTVAGMFNRLLTAGFPFVLTQSFTFLAKAAAQSVLQRQYNRLGNVGDLAVSQAEELRDALDALTSNEFVMGDHHFSLQVMGDGGSGARNSDPWARLKALNDAVAKARTILGDTGMVVAREDMALEAAFWAQLPGNFSFRPRKAPITSRNFAAMMPFHNYPSGRATGNHWGDALTLLVSSAQSPYYFSLHAVDPRDPDGGSRKDTGHTFICGPTGSGKTVFLGFCASMLQKQGATQVVFDKDRGLEILVRASGGHYLPLRNGVPTGFNPLMLDPSPTNVEFLKMWLRRLVERADQPLTVREEADLDQALQGTLALEPSARRLSRLLEFLDPTDAAGMHARLSRWCASSRGDYAWVFDNPEDRLGELMAESAIVGFDVTDFLDNDIARPPVTLYLFHVVRRLLDGRRLVVWMDEFAKILSDRAFEAFAKDGLKTWRKINGVAAFATQSPSDVLATPISRTLIEQTATKVFFPNADGNADDYIAGFGLTEREFRLVKEELEPGSRMFLVKQGHHSVVCRLDLKGFDFELDVISGRTGNVELVNRIIAEIGPEPHRWLPQFMAARKLH